jgi:Mitochondrial carrier protein
MNTTNAAGEHTESSHNALKDWIPSFAGAGAGAVTSILCSPLDLAKTRLQVQNAIAPATATVKLKYVGVFPTLRTIFLEEGLRGWYQGLTPALISIPVFWGEENMHTACINKNTAIISSIARRVQLRTSSGLPSRECLMWSDLSLSVSFFAYMLLLCCCTRHVLWRV